MVNIFNRLIGWTIEIYKSIIEVNIQTNTFVIYVILGAPPK